MYIPPRYRVTDDATIDAFLAATPFATLVTSGPGGLMATHLPVECSREGGVRLFRGHVSKANAQWKELQAAAEALLIFLGPHTYVSPIWYDHPNVPTWNYQAVHVSGTVRLVEGEELERAVRELSERHEPPSHPPPRFDIDRMPADLKAAELKGIVGFELRAVKVEAAFKLSQNRHDADFANIVKELKARGDDASLEVARAMERTRPAG